MFKLFCFCLILNFLIYSSRKTLYIPGVTVNTANNDKYYGLPNEIPALSSIFEKIKIINPNKYEAIQSISNIIGLFPLSEQFAFYNSIKNDDNLFDKLSYEENIKDKDLFYKQIESLNNYLTEEENRKILSLGAIKKIVAKFGFDSLDDENITIKIEQNINEILNAQLILDKCENEFLNNIFPVFRERRGYLLDIKLSNYNNNSENDKFLRDENKNYTIKGFYYNKDQSDNITKSFILTPYNSLFFSEKFTIEEEIIEKYIDSQFDDFNNANITLEKDIIFFNNKVKEYNIFYEINNNNEVDNGMLINTKNNSATSSSFTNDIINNSLIKTESLFCVKEKRNEDDNEVYYEGSEIKVLINQKSDSEEKNENKIFEKIENLGYDKQYVKKCLKDNLLCHATSVYFLLKNYDNYKC